MLSLDEFIKLRRGSHMSKLHNNLIPPSIASGFQTNNSAIIDRLNVSKYRLPNPRLEYAKRHINYSGVKLWNTEIPDELKRSTSIRCFKKNYQKLLLPPN